jgi:hypothetical protein
MFVFLFDKIALKPTLFLREYTVSTIAAPPVIEKTGEAA